MYNLFKRILRKTYLRYSLSKKTPRLFSLALRYFDSDFGHLKIEIFDHEKMGFSTFGFLASARSYKWLEATVSADIERFPCAAGLPLVFRLSGPLSGHPGAVVFTSISLYAGYDIDPLVYFVGGFEAPLRASVLNKIEDPVRAANEMSGSVSAISGWTGRFILEGRPVFGLMVSNEGRRDGYFQMRGVAETLSARFPLSFPAAAPSVKLPENSGTVKTDAADLNAIADNACSAAPLDEAETGEEKKNGIISTAAEVEAVPENEPEKPLEKSSVETAPSETLQPPANEEPISAGSVKSSKTEKPFTPYFFSDDASWPLKLKELDPVFVSGVIERADIIAAGRLGVMNKTFEIGEKFDFNNDFSGGTWPDFDSEALYLKIVPYPVWKTPAQKNDSNGDPLAAFHFSKQSFLITLGLAFKLTSDPKYASAAFDFFSRFRQKTSAGRGISYSSPSAVAQRAVSWALCRELFSKYEPEGNPFENEEFMPALAAEVSYALGRVSSRENILCPAEIIMSLLPVYGLLVLNPDFPERRSVLEKVFGDIQRYLSELINSEGSYLDGSLPAIYSIYQGMVFALASSLKAGTPSAPALQRKLSADPAFLGKIFSVSNFLRSMALPDGRLPLISDHFPEFHLPFSYKEGLDLLPLFQLVSFITGEKELKYLTANHKMAEIMMLFGEDGVSKFAALPVSPAGEIRTAFERTGYYVSSSSFGPYSETASATKIFFDAGVHPSPDGDDPWKCALAHADMQSFGIYHGGTDFICDAGPSIVHGGNKYGEHLRSARAHNVVILGKSAFYSADRDLGMLQMPMPHNVKFSDDAEKASFSCTHDGYEAAGLEAAVRRMMFFVKPYYLLVVDDVLSSRKRPSLIDAEIYFHLSPDVITAESNSFFHSHPVVLRSRKSEARIVMITNSLQKVTTSFYRGSQKPFMGWHSPEYGIVSESTTVINSVSLAKAPFRVCELFYFINSDDNFSALTKTIKFKADKPGQDMEIYHRGMKDVIKINEKMEFELYRNGI